MKQAIFRVDGSAAIGGGHIMRCLTLANALAESGWTCAFACAPGTLEMMPVLVESGHESLTLDGDAAGEVAAMHRRWTRGCDLLIMDHYLRDAAFESTCRGWARRILVIDDLADRAHDCDILLDQTLDREEADYRPLVPAACSLLLGPEYALLRPQFAEARAQTLAPRTAGSVRRILVMLGSSDPGNFTGLALRAIEQGKIEVAVDVVLGAAAPHLEVIRRHAQRSPLRVTVHASTNAMADLMAKADLAIGAAGSSSWERCCLGLPTLMLITADNQRGVAQELARVGAADLVGQGNETDPEGLAVALRALAADPGRRREMSEIAASLCDGRGVERVLPLLVGPLPAKDGADVLLRRAETADEATVFAWQQHPVTRRYSRNPKPPTADEHHAWFGARLVDSCCCMTIIQHGGRPAGVLRLDTRDRHGAELVFEISILIDPEQQGRGIGLVALRLARNLVPGAKLLAEILPGNLTSRRVFEAAGYQPCGNGLYYHAPLAQPVVMAAARP